MAGLTGIQESICRTVGSQLHNVASSSKKWVIIAGIVAGWAVGFFFVSKAILMPEEQAALMAITTYAGIRLALDAMGYLNWVAKWLLERGGEEGRMQLSCISSEAIDV